MRLTNYKETSVPKTNKIWITYCTADTQLERVNLRVGLQQAKAEQLNLSHGF